MNTKLEKLFEKYNFSQKDRFEISQIFFLLTEERKQNLLKNFDEFALSINKINSDIDTEKDILIWSAVEKIKNSILEYYSDLTLFACFEFIVNKKYKIEWLFCYIPFNFRAK